MNLAYCNQGTLIVFCQLSQFCIRRDDRITKPLGVHFVIQTDQTCNVVLAVLFDDIDACTRVAAGTDQDYVGVTHGATVISDEATLVDRSND